MHYFSMCEGQRKTDKNPDTIPVIVVTQEDVPKSTVVDTSKIKKLSTPKNFIANVTPRDVEIKMDNLGVKPKSSKGQSSKSRSKGATVEIAADVHVDGHHRVNSDTSIEIEPDDSYVIDFEEIGEDNYIMQSDLLKQHKIPMQVFIDETYDSMDEFSVSTIPSLSQGRRQSQGTKIPPGEEDLEVIEV